MGDKYVSIFLEVLAAVLLLLSLYPVMRYGTLAGIQVPQHYNKDGCVDIWTTREFFIYLGLISMALYSFISVCQSHPKMVNIPFSSKMSAQDRASLGKSIAESLKFWCMAMCAFLSISSYRIALGKGQCLNDTVNGLILTCAIVHITLILLIKPGTSDSQD